MLLINNVIDVNIYLYTYMFVYNLSLISFFWSLFSFITIKLKTLYTFSEFTQNSFIVLNLSVLLFSMAGVPPFIGFFSKLFIMVLVLNNYYFLFYFLFFLLLFLGLYFYMQNIRFLHSTNYKNHYTMSLTSERVALPILYFVITLLIVIVFGLVYIDDIILLFTWLFY
jgi:NADH:ubiquinone oxidoreductase subunit 2 (subunit N)